MSAGKVYLIGAGPGDPGLITQLGARRLAQAEVVVYDFLANPRLLALANPEAEIIYVGKKGGDHTLAQAEINQLLVAKAKEGRTVARLKGGDPFIFGRGAEEAEELVQAGVDFEVVPGVSSALAVPAYAGIPLTHRGHNSCLTLLTGHEDPLKPESGLDWAALVQSRATLVLLMGLRNLAVNTRALMDHGLDPATPAALIQWGTLPEQRTLTSPVQDIAARAREENFTSPAILVVGSVVGLRETLAWAERKPLWGLRVLVTRTIEGAGRLAETLSDLGAEPLIFPTIRIVAPADPAPLLSALARLADFDWLVFTSAHGVKYFFQYLDQMGRDCRALGRLKICAIGPATAGALKEHGLKADLVPVEYRAESVVESLKAQGLAGKRILLARAAEAREVLPQELTRLGAKMEVVAAYRNLPPPDADRDRLAELLASAKVDVALFTASSTVKNLAALLPGRPLSESLEGVAVGVIGPVTAETARKHGLAISFEAKEYTLPGLVAALQEWRRGQK